MISDEQPTPTPDPAMPWAQRVIVRTEVGSTAHGTGLPGSEDYDEMGVVLERWESAVGLFPDPDNIVYRPGRTITERSKPGDYDLVLYTPQKFARLAASGNPSVLMLLFGPLRFSTPLGYQLRALAPAFWSGRARDRFVGYSRAQRERLLGVREGAHTNRPELVAEHGYDTKYAMHMLRLGIQGLEYTTTGRLALPVPEPHGPILRDVRRTILRVRMATWCVMEGSCAVRDCDRASPDRGSRPCCLHGTGTAHPTWRPGVSSVEQGNRSQSLPHALRRREAHRLAPLTSLAASRFRPVPRR